MSQPITLTAPLAPIRRTLTVDDFIAYIVEKGWTPTMIGVSESADFFAPPPGVKEPMLQVHARSLEPALRRLAGIEGRPAGEILIEMAQKPEKRAKAGWSALPFVPEALRTELLGVLLTAEKAEELLGFAHERFCPESRISLMVATCDCAKAAKRGPLAIAKLDALITVLRQDLAAAKKEARGKPAKKGEELRRLSPTEHAQVDALPIMEWRFIHEGNREGTLAWIEAQAAQLVALIVQLREEPPPAGMSRKQTIANGIARADHIRRLHTLATCLRALAIDARRYT